MDTSKLKYCYGSILHIESSCLIEKELHFRPSISDPDMYIRRNVRGCESQTGVTSGSTKRRKVNEAGESTSGGGGGQHYYKLLLVYVDDVLCSYKNLSVADLLAANFVSGLVGVLFVRWQW